MKEELYKEILNDKSKMKDLDSNEIVELIDYLDSKVEESEKNIEELNKMLDELMKKEQ
ncbi:MAG: hypothetical protein IKF36_04360 [Bacilli bacterium]|nr:hypothetical protein [Bacilli bacterium]